jgi:HEAT repeat protein
MDVAQLIADLQSKDATSRAAAAEQLTHLEEGAQPAALQLVLATADADESVRQWATAALESLGAPAAEDLPELAKLLADPRLDVAYWAATLLGRLGPAATPAVTALVDSLGTHGEVAVRERCALALGQIGPAAISALAALQNAAADPRPRLSRLAKQAIEQITAL